MFTRHATSLQENECSKSFKSNQTKHASTAPPPLSFSPTKGFQYSKMVVSTSCEFYNFQSRFTKSIATIPARQAEKRWNENSACKQASAQMPHKYICKQTKTNYENPVFA
eukprot:m.353038 g.353038  ORF g.353038 m.353038 type:complete len:110 (+) comp16670_c0_seq1:513-842(+)